MKKNAVFTFCLSLQIVVLSSCNQQTLPGTSNNSLKTDSTSTAKNQTDEMEREFQALNDLLASNDKTSQHFQFPSSKTAKVKGKRGSIITINPADLETSTGGSIGDTIHVELKECLNQNQFMQAGVQTVSGGQLLASGGSYYINITSAGQQLRLKEGKTISAQFPRITDQKMSLFYGERDSLGKMEWTETPVQFASDNRVPTSTDLNNLARKNAAPLKNQPQTIFKVLPEYLSTFERIRARDSWLCKYCHLQPENQVYRDCYFLYEDMGYSYLFDVFDPNAKRDPKEMERIKMNQKYEVLYQAIELKQLGWINCDVFPKNQNKTTLAFEFENKEETKSALVFLKFKKLNSLMQICYYNGSANLADNQFKNVPVGEEVKLVAISMKHGKPHVFERDFKIAENVIYTMKTKEVSDKEFKDIMN
jgi:hypothetical protein